MYRNITDHVPSPNYKSDHHPETDAFENNLLPVLRLLSNSRALKRLKFYICFPPFKLHNWDKFSEKVRRTLSDMIHSPYLTCLIITLAHANVSPKLFVGLKGVRTLCLDQVELSDVGDKDVPEVS